jgi:hypothetical protein
MCGGDDTVRQISTAMQEVVRTFVHGDELGWPALPPEGGAQTIAVFGGRGSLHYDDVPPPRLRV